MLPEPRIRGAEGRRARARGLANGTAAGLLVGYCSLFCAQAQAASLSVAQVPLFVSAAVEPNVMLLIDTSGSMDNIIWADDYDPEHVYEDWSYNWSPSDGNVFLSSLYDRWNERGWYQGRRDGVTKKLKLPDPVGSEDTRYSGNYLNYLFQTYDDGTDLTQGQIPNDYRMNVARTVASDLVANTGGMRFGVARFHGPYSQAYGHGATIDRACGSSTSDLQSTIDGYASTTNTPLGEALYEVTRYFRGMSSYYHGNTEYTSPIQYRCQKNFTIVITDGLPTYDTDFPDDDPADPDDRLPNWDGQSPATVASDYPNFPPFSDGFQPDGNQADEGYSLYLDDIAKFAFDTDLRTGGTDAYGKSFDAEDFPKQNLNTYTIGFSIDNQMLEDAASAGDGQYFTANNAAELQDKMRDAIADIQGRISSSSSVATNSTRLDTDTLVFQGRFNSEDWSGDLLAMAIRADGSVGDQVWRASEQMPAAASRKIMTWDPAHLDGDGNAAPQGAAFLWASLNAAQQAHLDKNAAGTTDGLGADRVAYLRGDAGDEVRNGGGFRNRPHAMGDIVNSDPFFVANPDYGYGSLPGAEGEAYDDYRAANSAREPMVYVGANDGMLHGFVADGGQERLAYVPNELFPTLPALSAPDYRHRYYVDGSVIVGDAWLGEQWRTVLLGSTGAGGRAVFALDVTDPSAFSAADVMWEFTHAELGTGIGQPAVVRLPTGDWVGIFGNGYNSSSQRAQLFIVDLEDPSEVTVIDTGVGDADAPNGLGPVLVVDTTGDRNADTVYAGDLHGNLWKFDLGSSNANNPGWDVAIKDAGVNQPLFRAVDRDGAPQPITARPEAGLHPDGGIMVYFGTGKYFEIGDGVVPDAPQVQSFYAIRDLDATVTGRAQLQQQTIVAQLTHEGEALRVVSEQTGESTQGWYLDLVYDDDAEGERVVSPPILRFGRVIFTTLIPDQDPCAYGGSGWLMELDALTGKRLDYAVFDVNGDGRIDSNDYVTIVVDGEEVRVPASGTRSESGIIKNPGIISAGEREFKYASSSSGEIEVTTEAGNPDGGRHSWRQLR